MVSWWLIVLIISAALGLALVGFLIACLVVRSRRLARTEVKKPLLTKSADVGVPSPAILSAKSTTTPPAFFGGKPIEFILPNTLTPPVSLVQVGRSVSENDLTLPALGRVQGRRGSLSPAVSMEELDRGLYGDEDEDLCGLTTVRARGRLHFSAAYDNAHEYLLVEVLRATWLRSSVGAARPDTYVHLAVETREGVLVTADTFEERPPPCTHVVRASSAPEYAQSFTLPLPARSLPAAVLTLSVGEYDRFSRRARLGEIRYPLTNLSDSYPGTEYGARPDVWRDILPDNEVLTSRGEVLISLCRQKKTLMVGLLELKDLTPGKLTHAQWEAAYLYVRLSLVVRDTALRRRRSRLLRFGACAVINEEFSLEVDEADYGHMALCVAVCCRDDQGRSLVLGKACVGAAMFSDGAALQHWTDFVSVRGKLVEHWHSLH